VKIIKEKTIKDWIEYHPDKKIRTLAMHNCIILKTQSFFMYKSNFASLIRSAFAWSDTLEDYDFWHDIYEKNCNILYSIYIKKNENY
jgi:hypothetical protein